MKFLVTLVVCLTFASVLALNKEEIKAKMKAAHEKCQTDPATSVKEDEMKALRESKFQGPAPANIGPYSLCLSKGLGWQNADGSINKEFLKARIAENVEDAARVDEIYNECAVVKENDIETAEHLFKCFFKIAKVRQSE